MIHIQFQWMMTLGVIVLSCYANCLHKKRVSDFGPSETLATAVSSPGFEPGTH